MTAAREQQLRVACRQALEFAKTHRRGLVSAHSRDGVWDVFTEVEVCEDIDSLIALLEAVLKPEKPDE